MLPYIYGRPLYYILVMAVFSLSFHTSFAADNNSSRESDISKIRFSYFQNLSSSEYLERCMPHLSNEQRNKILPVYESLLSEKQTGILEDDQVSSGISDLGQFKSEGGFSFPPISIIQGPFILACSTFACSPLNVLDFGAGGGNDTIMALLTERVAVIGVDIYEKQLQHLKQRVESKCQDFKIVKFSTLKRNFSDAQKDVPPAYVGKIKIININKVFHFLTHEETQVMVRNAHTLLKDGMLAFITVSTPKPGSAEAIQFEKQKQSGNGIPGPVYYECRRQLYTSGPNHTITGVSDKVETVALTNNKHNLPSPGHKVEKIIQNTGEPYYGITCQGRYYHDLQTLTNYVNPCFDVLDSIVHNYDGEDYFLSIIAKKRPSLN